MLLQVHVDGAGARALAAAHAAERAQALGVVGELVVHALTPALALFVARVVARGVQGEGAHATAVPGTQALALLGVGLVLNVEAYAGRAHEGAGAATEAAQALFGPQRAVELGGELLLQNLGVEGRRNGGGRNHLGLARQRLGTGFLLRFGPVDPGPSL